MIIGFHGVKHSGKSTAADHLIADFGFREVSFAQPLKDSTAALFDITVEDIEQMKNEAYPAVTVTFPSGMRKSFTMREILQRNGTEAHRLIPEFGTDIWTNMAAKKFLDGGGFNKHHFVCADCRFVNEAETVRACGGVVIWVRRDEVENAGDGHASEDPLPPELIDMEIDNNGTKDDLKTRLDILMHGQSLVTLAVNHGTD